MTGLTDRVKEKTGESEEQAAANDQVADLVLGDGLYRWLEQRSGYFERALPSHLEKQAPTFALTAMVTIRKSKALMRCDKDSLLTALIQAAHFGLLPDGKQSALVPYGNEARFMPMVEGLTDMMYRSGAVLAVRRGLIHENDDWDITPSAPPPNDFRFRPDLLSERGEPVLAYAFCWMRGGGRSELITFNRAEVEKHRDRFSKAYQQAESNGRRNSTWHEHFERMWQKTPVRRLATEVPTSPEMRLLLLADDAADSTLTEGPYRPVIPLNPAEWEQVPGDDAPPPDDQAGGDGDA